MLPWTAVPGLVDSPTRQAPVSADAFGLYDMLGNKREWVNDYWWDYSSAAQTDPTGPATGTYAIWRGGCGDDNVPYDALTCGSRFRDFRRDQGHYGLTFRTVLPIRQE